MPLGFREALREEGERAGLALRDDALALAATHARMLLAANLRTNITRITDVGELARRHFVESFLAAALLPPPSDKGALRVLDVGSGGGFPGLAARIVRPDIVLTMLEPRRRKATLLEAVAALHAAPRPEVLACTLAEASGLAPCRVAMLRAVTVRPGHLTARLEPFGAAIVLFPGRERELPLRRSLERGGWRTVASRDLPTGGRVVIRLERA